MDEEQKKKKSVYDAEYIKTNIDRTVIQTQKAARIPELLRLAVNRGLAPSRQAYIIDAIKQRLDADGISAADLDD